MRRLWIGLGLALGMASVACAESISDVLQRSQQMRLAARGPAGHLREAEVRIRASFDRLMALLPAETHADLVFVGGDLFAEAVFGRRQVAVSQAVGDLPEGERLLILGHELGHVTLDHWGSLSGLYTRFIPGEVRPETTDPVGPELSRQAHVLSHQQEYEADAFGYALAHKLGFGMDTAFDLLTRQGMQNDSATHPGTRRRLAQFRLMDTELGQGPLYAGEARPTAASMVAAGLH